MKNTLQIYPPRFLINKQKLHVIAIIIEGKKSKSKLSYEKKYIECFNCQYSLPIIRNDAL